MKRIILTVLLGAALYIDGKAQNTIAPIVGISQHFNDVVIGANAEFMIQDTDVSLSPDIILYMPLTEGGVKKNWIEINFNGHYYIFKHKGYQFYGLGGLNYTGNRYKYKATGEVTHSNTLNANVGGGVNFKIGRSFTPFSEIKYVMGKNNLVIVAGVKFLL